MTVINIFELQGYGLSYSEARVAERVLTGITNRQAASELNISEKTVKFHLTNCFKKFGVKSRSQLIAKFFAKKVAPQNDDLPVGLI